MQITNIPVPINNEVIDDRVATVLEAGTNITLTYDDAANVLTIDATPGGSGYTDEQAQDAVGNILQDSATIDYVYNDATPYITGLVKDNSITESMLSLSDLTTQDVSITKHGFVPKAPNIATQFLDGTGAWSVPAGGSESFWLREDTSVSTLGDGLLAFWRMEETTGNRLDSISSLALVPNGGATYGIGKHSNAAKLTGVAGTYFSIADNATLSIGAAQNFTIACWVNFDATPPNNSCIVGKGNTSISYDAAEYMLWTQGTTIYFTVGNGSSRVNVNSGFVPVVGTWFFVLGWLDAASNLIYIQINNGTPISAACLIDSYDSAHPFEVGRTPNWSGAPIINARVDDVMFYKRILNADERTALYNSGAGLDYADLGGGSTFIYPETVTDLVIAGATSPTAQEPLESARGIKLGNSAGTVDGIIRWTGSDLEVRKGGAWISLTSGVSHAFLLMGA